jgi:hypothetical protein
MDTKIYEGVRKVTLKDGTIREYKTRKVYAVKPKKEVTKTELSKKVLTIDDPNKLLRIKAIIEE